MRTALVAYNAIFHDLGDKRKPEYLEQIISDSLNRGFLIKDKIVKQLEYMKIDVTESIIKNVINWNRTDGREHDLNEIKLFISSVR